MKTLHISIWDKIATYRQRDGEIVCGNSDYQIEFSFDSEWASYSKKTARFIVGKEFTDVDFTGTICPVPVLRNTTEVSVGVYAGDLCTTTPAPIGCKPSILCPDATPTVENDQNYANEAKAAAEKAAKDAAEEVARLVGEIGVAQEPGGSVTAAISQKAATNSFANALKGYASGEVVTFGDVTPLPAKVEAKVRSKNLCNIAEKTSAGNSAWSSTHIGTFPTSSGEKYTVSADFNQNGEAFSKICIAVRDGSTGLKYVGESNYSTAKIGRISCTFVAPENENSVRVYAYSNMSATVLNTSCIFSNIQIEEGTTATPYTPFMVEGTPVTVKTCGKNLFDPSVLLAVSGWTETNGVYRGGSSDMYNAHRLTAKSLVKGFVKGKQYAFSATIIQDVTANAEHGIAFYFLYDDGTTSTINYESKFGTAVKYSVVSDIGKNVVGLHFSVALCGGFSISNIGCQEGTEAIYEPYIEGETVYTNIGENIELDTIAPSMTIATDNANAIVGAEYSKDTSIVIEKLVQAIISLGGTV